MFLLQNWGWETIGFHPPSPSPPHIKTFLSEVFIFVIPLPSPTLVIFPKCYSEGFTNSTLLYDTPILEIILLLIFSMHTFLLYILIQYIPSMFLYENDKCLIWTYQLFILTSRYVIAKYTKPVIREKAIKANIDNRCH